MEDKDMSHSNAVTGDMLVGDIVSAHPEVIDTLFSVGMHCIGCPSSRMESLNDAAFVHGLDPEKVLAAVNSRIQEGN